MKLQAIGWLAMMGFAGVAVAVNEGDKAMNYADANARVAEVLEEKCYLKKGDTKWTPNGDDMTCSEVEKLGALDAEARDAELKGQRKLEVRYISPVDNAEHTGTVWLTDSQPGFEDVDDGDVVVILAHMSDADKIRAR